MVIFNHFWFNIMDTISRNTRTYKHACAHVHTHTHTLSHPMSRNMQINGSPCMALWTRSRTSVIDDIMLLLKKETWSGPSPLSSFLGQSPNFLIWHSMSFTSPESLLVSPLSPVFFLHLPFYCPALPHFQSHSVGTSFHIHLAVPCLFSPYPTFPLTATLSSGPLTFQVAA